MTHRIHPVSDSRKADLLTHVLTQPPIGQALVFCKTKRGSNRVGERLERAGVKAAVIHGNKSQGARNRALGDFKAGRVTVLVATDIAARGLDIAQLPLVVNFDLPLVAADYIHRIGRTGRAGLAGRAVSPGHCRRARPAARHPAALARSARAGRRRRLRGEGRVARRALRRYAATGQRPARAGSSGGGAIDPAFQRRVRLHRPGRSVMRTLAWLLVLASIGGGHVLAQEHHHGGARMSGEQLGVVSFSTSCSAAVQKDFERGVALLHSFWYEESEKQFLEIANAGSHRARSRTGASR